MEGGDPDLDVRTVSGAGGVGGRQGECRRCGDACDSLCHEDEEAGRDLDHRKLGPDTDLVVNASDSRVVVVGADKGRAAASCPEVDRGRRISACLAEGTARDHPAEAALAQRFSNGGMPYARVRRLAPVRRLV
jgi:hypothetical protein